MKIKNLKGQVKLIKSGKNSSFENYFKKKHQNTKVNKARSICKKYSEFTNTLIEIGVYIPK